MKALPPVITNEDKKISTYARAMQKTLIEVGFWKTCLNCGHWSDNNPVNKKEDICHKYHAKPPSEVIVLSCGLEWYDHGIPF